LTRRTRPAASRKSTPAATPGRGEVADASVALPGLQCAYMDLHQRVLHVRHTAQRVYGSGKVFGPPKSARSRLDIPLRAVTVGVLEEHRRRQEEEERRGVGALTGRTRGWCSRRRLAPSSSRATWLVCWTAWSRRPGRLIRLHDMRQTCASLLLAQGGSARRNGGPGALAARHHHEPVLACNAVGVALGGPTQSTARSLTHLGSRVKMRNRLHGASVSIRWALDHEAGTRAPRLRVLANLTIGDLWTRPWLERSSAPAWPGY